MEPRDGQDVDPQLERALRALDPGAGDGMYWTRFHRDVLRSAAGALEERRRRAELTMEDLVASWSRTLVPSALLAAAVAGFLLVRATTPAPDAAPLSVQEMLSAGIEDEPVPALVGDFAAAGDGAITFASDRY